MRVNPVVTATALLLPMRAWGHSPWVISGPERAPLFAGVAVLLVVWLAYGMGVLRSHPGWQRVWAFNAAGAITAFALFGPLDRWAETSAAFHMTQHMLMMVVIAPLWVMAQPLPQLAVLGPWWKSLWTVMWKSFWTKWKSFWTAMFKSFWTAMLSLARHPMLAATVHAAVIWFWHAPRFYVLALDNAWWHVVEHASFLLSAGIFWWAVLRSSHRNAPHAFVALLFTLMHTGFLGALLTFANAPLYGENRDLQSQQLAGLIMWVLGGIPYLGAAAWIAARWFQQILRRVE